MNDKTNTFVSVLAIDPPDFEVASNILKNYKVNINDALILILKKYHPTIKSILYLLKNGANINYQCQETGMTPIMIAIDRNNKAIVEIILDNNADLTLMDNYGNTIEYYVKKSDNRQILLLLDVRTYKFKYEEEQKKYTKLERDYKELEASYHQLISQMNELGIKCVELENRLNGSSSTYQALSEYTHHDNYDNSKSCNNKSKKSVTEKLQFWK